MIWNAEPRPEDQRRRRDAKQIGSSREDLAEDLKILRNRLFIERVRAGVDMKPDKLQMTPPVEGVRNPRLLFLIPAELARLAGHVHAKLFRRGFRIDSDGDLHPASGASSTVVQPSDFGLRFADNKTAARRNRKLELDVPFRGTGKGNPRRRDAGGERPLHLTA